MAGRLQSDPLFQGLTRPAMFWGVDYRFFVANAFISMLVFINTQKGMLVAFIAVSLYILAFIICAKEPRIMDMVIVKQKKGFRCMNKRTIHGGANSYDLF